MIMTTIDDAIRDALSPGDAQAYEALGRELSPFGEAIGMFRSVRSGYIWTVALAGTAFLALGVYAAWRLMHESEVRAMLGWSLLAIFAMLTLALVKVWFWLEIQRNALVREMKRIELQVASLVALMPRS
jgi:4-amino-4-deoxy-L-arabinose transferase-like glycosyltransferase